ncbi:stAR-related lipid transfer protein 13-like [Amphibalanus amphitrite]|uniref:stAR-related lipid transfer protein 13-like n=1 Tax=Amphibalanus amphitrite TaxID=1232801 RepID=UPI001C90BE5E|nr:stAR-related lipid transfer protein 13-like [Amphibalanus amphitrite]
MLDMKLELVSEQMVHEDVLAQLAPSGDPWLYGRHSQRWRMRPTLGATADSSAPSGGSNSTLSSESSVGAAVAQEPRRSSRDRIQESAAAFLRRVESMRARRRRRKTDPPGGDSHRHLGGSKGDGYAISNIEAPLSLERLGGQEEAEPAEPSPLSRWLRGGSVRLGRRTTASWRPSSLNMGQESGAYRKKVQNKLKKRKELREAALPPLHKSASCTPQSGAPAPLIVYNRSYVDNTEEEEEDVSPSSVRENRANSSPMISGLAQWRNRSNSCSNTLDHGSECSLASSTGATSPDQADGRQRRSSVVRWHSFRRESAAGSAPLPPTDGGDTPVSQLTTGQIQSLRNHALLRITTAVQRYCPSKSAGWGWELPKLMRRRRADPDYRSRRVFGVPLTVVAQRGAGPLPAPVVQALEMLRRTALEQVGLFRKSGVRSRIQQLRLICEAAGDEEQVTFDGFSAFDVADLVKQYLRELPEVLLTSRVSQMLITIYQYVPAELRLDLVRCALLLLPDESRLALQTLLTFLGEVAAASEANQMTAHNLAVCLAPSVLAVTSKRSSSASPRRTRRAGLPAQRELDENRAAHECLAELIRQGDALFRLPAALLSRCRFSYLDVSQPVALSSLGTEEQPGSWRAYTDSCCTALVREARDKPRGWVTVPCVPAGASCPSTPTTPSTNGGSAFSVFSGSPSSSPLPPATTADVELAYRKVGDGHRLRLWRAAVEVEAPPSEALQRILRQRHAFNMRVVKWRVVERLAEDAEVYQYAVSAPAPLPATEFCVLRAWRTDLARGACALVETSIEHPESPAGSGARRGVVLASRYLVEPCGSGRSKVTHFSRVEQRGLSVDWYSRVYGHECARELAALRQSFCHVTEGPESRV